MGKPRAPVEHCGESKSDGSGRPTTIAARTPPVFRPCFSQGAAQRRLEPSRPGAETLALPKTKHPGPDIPRAEDNAVGVVVQTLGGVRHIISGSPGCSLRPHLRRLAHSTRKWTASPSLFPPSARRSPGPPCKRGLCSLHFGGGPLLFRRRRPVSLPAALRSFS